MNNISFGRHLPLKSLTHSLDPRLKLLSIICLIATIVINNGFTGYILFSGAIIGLFFVSRLPFKLLISLLRFTIVLSFFLLTINFLVVKPAKGAGYETIGTFLNLKYIVFSWKAIAISLHIVLRIYFMILLTTILTSTTKPLDLTLALEDIIWPLKLIKIPIHIISIIISMALRMLPTLFEEAIKIKKAQASRGMDSRNGNIKDKVKSIISLIIPLLISSFQRAEDMAFAMDARGYNPHQKRTRYRQYKIKLIDWIFFIFFAGLLVGAILLSTIGADFINNLSFWKPIRYVDSFVNSKIIY